MKTAIAVNARNTNPPVMSLVQDIPLNRIQESKTNPRRSFDETKLAELASNIRQHGVIALLESRGGKPFRQASAN